MTLFAATATAVAPAPEQPFSQTAFRAFPTPSPAPGTPQPQAVSRGTRVQPPIADFPTGPFEPRLAPRLDDPGPGVIVVRRNLWRHDPEVSWYGPGFYGRRTACGLAMTTSLIGVAHRTLPCGTLVAFRWAGRVVRARVIDRGPYVSGRQWDLTGGLCQALRHCFTGPIDWRFV